MEALAVVLNRPESLSVNRVALTAPGDLDVVVDVAFSGISTGTERLLWQGRMPPFPGMGYPLVPGYESVGRIVAAGPGFERRVGETVFVPGANCFGDIRGLFGGAASRLVVPAARAVAIEPSLGERGILLALAATTGFVARSGAQWQAQVFRDKATGAEQLAIVHGTIDPGKPYVSRYRIVAHDGPPDPKLLGPRRVRPVRPRRSPPRAVLRRR